MMWFVLESGGDLSIVFFLWVWGVHGCVLEEVLFISKSESGRGGKKRIP